MSKKRTDDPAGSVADVDDGEHDSTDESAAGGRDQSANVGTMLYTRDQRREFLIEATLHPESSRWVDDPADPFVFGIAKTAFQFKRALCDFGYPNVKRLSRDDMQRLMADELRGEE